MTWKETCVMKERILFIEDYLRDEFTMTELSRAYGVSRKTAYKWVAVFKEEGYEALGDRSPAPKTHPNATPEAVEREILAARAAHPTWGARKLLAWLARRDPDQRWPVASTIGAILQRHALDPAAAAATAHGTLHRALCRHNGAQRYLVRRLQGLVPNRRRAALRSVDHQRRS